MEFIFNLLELVIVILFALYVGMFIGSKWTKKKFQPHDEAPKVGKHKESKEVCHFPDDGCIHDYKLKCKKCTLYY